MIRLLFCYDCSVLNFNKLAMHYEWNKKAAVFILLMFTQMPASLSRFNRLIAIITCISSDLSNH